MGKWTRKMSCPPPYNNFINLLAITTITFTLLFAVGLKIQIMTHL